MDIEEEWRRIFGFNGYEVSNLGQVRNSRTRAILQPFYMSHRHGYTVVSLMREGVQLKRGLALLVAEAFLPDPPHPTFISVINKDGHRANNRVYNLAWRPIWFTTKYWAQFRKPPIEKFKDVVEIESGIEYPTSWEAAIHNGLLSRDVVLGIYKDEPVWPTYQRFALL